MRITSRIMGITKTNAQKIEDWMHYFNTGKFEWQIAHANIYIILFHFIF